jgi:hypothetical protein
LENIDAHAVITHRIDHLDGHGGGHRAITSDDEDFCLM